MRAQSHTHREACCDHPHTRTRQSTCAPEGPVHDPPQGRRAVEPHPHRSRLVYRRGLLVPFYFCMLF